MGRVADTIEERSLLRHPGAIMFVSCYELGHQPLGIAQPMGFLEQAGFAPVGLDIAVENIDESALRLARFVGISVPMHTALRLGVRVAELIRTMNPACHICFYGLYASINAEYLLQRLADSVVGGEYEIPLQFTHRSARSGSGDQPPRRSQFSKPGGRSFIAACLCIHRLDDPPSNPKSRRITDVGPICSARTERHGTVGRVRRGQSRMPPSLSPLPDRAGL